MPVLVAVLVLVILIILASCIKIVPQATALVMERLGAYNGTWEWEFILRRPLSTGWQEE